MQALLNLAAERTQLYLSPVGQPHATLPSGAATPIYSEDFYTFLIQLAESQQSEFPNNNKLATVLRQLDARAHSSNLTQPVPLRTSQSGPGTVLIDLQENFEAIELTRKGWSLTHNFDAPFLRPTQNIPLPAPEQPQHDLTTYLTQLFEIEPEPAQQLSHWLALALMPNEKPPILVITGEARDEAASKLRTLIDPVPQPLFPLPATTSQLGQLALTNKVLAFVTYGPLTEIRKAAFNRLRKGMPVRLKETNRRRSQIFDNVSRPIIIVAESEMEIGRHQISVEINKANQAGHAQMLGALLNVAAQAICPDPQVTIETDWEAITPTAIDKTTQSDAPDT